jgi:hypothetical protein
MTELNQEEIPQTQVSGDVVPAQNAPVERTFKQEDINRIVQGVKRDAYEKGKNDTIKQLHASSGSPESFSSASQQPQGMGGMPAHNPVDVEKLVEAKLQAHMHQRQLNDFGQQYEQKMMVGSKKYPDFDKTVEPLEIVKKVSDNPNFVLLTGSVDNTHDVLYDLAKPENADKLSRILTLSRESPQMAKMHIDALSQSIKQNELATQQKQPNPPLEQLKTSNAGMGSGDKPNKGYFKNNPKYRG